MILGQVIQFICLNFLTLENKSLKFINSFQNNDIKFLVFHNFLIIQQVYHLVHLLLIQFHQNKNFKIYFLFIKKNEDFLDIH